MSAISQAISRDRLRRGLRRDRRRARGRRARLVRSQPAAQAVAAAARPRRIVATMAQCDWFLPSLDEARTLSGADAPDAIIDWCHAQGAPVVALKCGADGCVVSGRAAASDVAAHRVASVDATGAGDCFDGAFVARRRRRRRSVHGGALRQRRGGAGDDRLRRGGAAAARARRARAARFVDDGRRSAHDRVDVSSRTSSPARSRWWSAGRAASAPASPTRSPAAARWSR